MVGLLCREARKGLKRQSGPLLERRGRDSRARSWGRTFRGLASSFLWREGEEKEGSCEEGGGQIRLLNCASSSQGSVFCTHLARKDCNLAIFAKAAFSKKTQKGLNLEWR
ncbi:Hypothetical predicted protein [Podarcis lilfordi]|uniref:Uncharacterized protein n=1 Tax=Podarcis lilfordi TaxID=74358 RepID=A0AA35NYM1_9SAUR|nr:Hypothetical predicted protein [Podarcis lilfordi]